MQVYNFNILLPLAIRFVFSSFAFIVAHAKKAAFAKMVFTTETTTVINEYQIQSRGGNIRNGYIIDCLQTYSKISALKCFHLCQQITCQRSCEAFMDSIHIFCKVKAYLPPGWVLIKWKITSSPHSCQNPHSCRLLDFGWQQQHLCVLFALHGRTSVFGCRTRLWRRWHIFWAVSLILSRNVDSKFVLQKSGQLLRRYLRNHLNNVDSVRVQPNADGKKYVEDVLHGYFFVASADLFLHICASECWTESC